MSQNWQFRFAIHAGITVVYPVRSLPESPVAGHFPGAKFAIAVAKSVRIVYPVEGLESLNPEVIKAKSKAILSILKGPEKPESITLLSAIVRGIGLAEDWNRYKTESDQKLRHFLKDKGLKSHHADGTVPRPKVSPGQREVEDQGC